MREVFDEKISVRYENGLYESESFAEDGILDYGDGP